MHSIMRLCPRCRKVSFVSSMTWNATCPHCGFNMDAWAERRGSPRLTGRHPVIVQGRNTRCSGFTLDYTENGLKIEHRGNPLSLHERISVDVKDLAITGPAEVLWTRIVDDGLAQAGIAML